MEWLSHLESQLEDATRRLTDAYRKLSVVKDAIWGMVERHGELKADALEVFATLRTVISTKSPLAAFALVADVQKIVADAQAAYANEKDALAAILASLKSLAG